MQDIVLIGLNHNTAPVELRECIAFPEGEIQVALARLADIPVIEEVMLISTCNRMEILLISKNRQEAVQKSKQFLSCFKALPIRQFDDALYVLEGEDAVRHVFRVASSLDSMVLGEPQILGQIKSAYLAATQSKTSGVILNRLLHRTFFVAKRVRSETGIGDNAVSISYAAIELGRKIFDSLKDKKVLLVGAGEMAELAVDHLIRHKATDIFVANRTFERGVHLAKKFNGRPLRFEEIPAMLRTVDIIISSTGSSDFIIRRKQVKEAMKKRRNSPLFFIDIAVPRDIDPEINRLDNAYVYDIDDLKGVIEENLEDRKKEAGKAERIIDEAVIRFREWYLNLDVVPTIVALRGKMESIALTELEKTLQSLGHLTDADRDAMLRMTQAMIKKIMHHPTQLLKSDSPHINKASYLDFARRLFKLDE
ncbi:MAG: glutamyl-tRNA reductase [Deltaproteobacteria bacterium]|nr:glutamyl-tRNA reductase [Deltaproteobacteria bacterium]